jgi:hypothetical protein
MTQQGSLVQRDFAEILQELGRSRWTGLLRLERSGERFVITVEHGRLVFAASSNPDHRLGPMLLRRGAITLKAMEEAGRALKSGKRIGTVLVEQGALDAKELVPGVVDQSREIILSAFQWTAGEFRLEEGATPDEPITLDISTPQLIHDGLSRVEAWSRVHRGCGGLAARYAPAPGADAAFKELTLGFDEAALFRAIKGPRDVESLCAGSSLSDFEVCRTLWAFRVIGLVRRLEETATLDQDGLEYVLPSE